MAALRDNAIEPMIDHGTASFADLDEYECAFGGPSVQLTVTGRGDFKASLTRLNLRHLQLLRGSEDLARIAYIALPTSRIFVSFPTSGLRLIWDGLEVGLGDIVFHGRGERFHQRTTGEGRWGLVSLPASQLASYSKSLIGRKIAAPPVGRVLRPQRTVAARLLRLHKEACRVAEANDGSCGRQAAASASEQELARALFDCLAADRGERNSKKRQRYANIMVRFEEVLAAHAGRQLSISELSSAIDVPERTMRVCCTEFLGVSPTRYLLLRRMNMVRSALRHADPTNASVAEIARSHQFSELGRFAVVYRRIFGEMPSTTLSRTC